MKRIFLWVLILSLSGATGSYGDDSGTIENPQSIPDSIVISTNRFATPLEQTASSITVITSKQIDESQATQVIDILKTVPGLNLVQSGGMGTVVSTFIRGGNSQHALVMIDGVKMNDPGASSSSFDFAHLSIDNIERIEVLRGPQSVLYGSDAMSGIIRIFTKQGYGKANLSLNSEVGSYDTYNEELNINGSMDKLNYALSLNRTDSKGYSIINKDQSGYDKDGYTNTSFSGNLGYTINNSLNLVLSGKIIDAEADIDKAGYTYVDDPNYITKSKVKYLSLGGFHSPVDSKFSHSLKFSISNHISESIDDYDEINQGEKSNFTTDGNRYKLNWQGVYKFTKDYSIIAGVENEWEEFSSDNYYETMFYTSADTVSKVDAHTTSNYILNRITLFENWHNSIGFRYDNHQEFGGNLTYRITSTYIIKDLDLKLKGTYGTAFKAPSLFNLYHPLYGNKNLEPEESDGYDIGFEKRFSDKINIDITYFNNQYKELIGYDPITYETINIDEVSTDGVEAILSLNLIPSNSITFSYNYTEAVDKADGSLLLRRPKHKGSLNISQEINNRLDLEALFLITGERKDRDFETYQIVTLEKYNLLNLSASYQLNETIKLKSKIINLFDESYEEVVHYNTPGRSVYFGFNLTI